MTLTDTSEMHSYVTANLFSVDEGNDTITLEGNVRFEFDDMLITASRALARGEPDGSTFLQIDDAIVVRSGAGAAPSSE